MLGVSEQVRCWRIHLEKSTLPRSSVAMVLLRSFWGYTYILYRNGLLVDILLFSAAPIYTRQPFEEFTCQIVTHADDAAKNIGVLFRSHVFNFQPSLSCAGFLADYFRNSWVRHYFATRVYMLRVLLLLEMFCSDAPWLPLSARVLLTVLASPQQPEVIPMQVTNL